MKYIFIMLIIKAALKKLCATMHTHTQSTWPILWTESLISLFCPNPKRLADLQHQALMAVLRNDLFLSSDRGIRGSKASLLQELCLTLGLTELGSLRLVAEVNPRAAPVRVLGDCGAPAFLWGREEKLLEDAHVKLFS